MAKPKFTKRRLRKRTLKKRKNRIVVKNSSSVGKELTMALRQLFPPQYRANVRYSQTFGLTSGTAGLFGTDQVMRLTNIYDPDLTGTGHQPYGLDQISGYYSKYQVQKVKVTLIWSTIGGTAEMCCAYKIQSNANASYLAGKSVDQVTEQPETATIMLSASGNNRVVEQNVSGDIAKMFGISKKQYIDDGYIAQAYSNTQPVNIIGLFLSVGMPSGGSATQVTCQCIIDYSVTFMERIDQVQS